MYNISSLISAICKPTTCLLALLALTSCSTLVPKASDNFRTYFDYASYDTAVFSSMGASGGITTNKGKKHLYYNYAKLAEYGVFPIAIFKIKSFGTPVWAVNNEVNSGCLFSKQFTSDEAMTWSQQRISKEYYLCSSLNGFSPAMIKLASAIRNDSNERYGNSIEWIVKAAEYGNPDAIRILSVKGIRLPTQTSTNEILKHDLEHSKAVDLMFINHDPVSGRRNWNNLMQSHNENMNGLSNLIKVAAVVAVGAAVVEDMGKHPARYNSVKSIATYPSQMSTSLDSLAGSSTIFEPLKSVTVNQNTIQNSSATNSCECKCVNGTVRAICSSSIAIAPICSPNVCPIIQPSLKPIATPQVAPVGTNQCSLQQVYNSTVNKYEWKNLCY